MSFQKKYIHVLFKRHLFQFKNLFKKPSFKTNKQKAIIFWKIVEFYRNNSNTYF